MLLINDPCSPNELVSRPNRPWTQLLARFLSSSLDRQLVAGRPPESSRLLAAHAERLVSPSLRRALAKSWEDLLKQLRRPPAARSPRAPLCRKSIIIIAEPAVHRMLSALVAPVPIGARGVAMARQLLSDGVGPLYNPHCSVNLQTALEETRIQLDPLASLISSL